MMFTTQSWSNVGKKRSRDEEEDEPPTLGFSAHRDKRHLSALPFRASNFQRLTQPQNLTNFPVPPTLQAPSTITPVDSSNENSPVKQDCENKSFFSPYSSPPIIIQSSNESFEESSSPMRKDSLCFSIASSQDTAMYSDHDMMETYDRESYNLSPGPYQPDRDYATTIRERIPTPRHTNFFTSSYMENTDSHPRASRQTVRLPSPISEGEPSPSMQLGGMAYVSMELEPPSSPIPPIPSITTEEVSPTTHKKGHTRSKHSLRDWNGIGAGNLHSSSSGKKKFSMGYRVDCQQCRDRVPGHFSHVYICGDDGD